VSTQYVLKWDADSQGQASRLFLGYVSPLVSQECKFCNSCYSGPPLKLMFQSIHIDDLSRNFALNPGEGLKIRAFKGAGTEEGLSDKELVKLGNYVRVFWRAHSRLPAI
jgi:hypothetical protein